MLDMKTASIRAVQHQLAAMIAEVAKGGEIVITRHRRPVARLAPVNPAPGKPAPSAAAIRRYWRERPLPAPMRTPISNADLVAEGRGDV